MTPALMIPTILLPILSGICLPALKIEDDSSIKRFTILTTVLTSLLTWGLILTCSDEALYIVSFANRLHFMLRLDGMQASWRHCGPLPPSIPLNTWNTTTASGPFTCSSCFPTARRWA